MVVVEVVVASLTSGVACFLDAPFEAMPEVDLVEDVELRTSCLTGVEEVVEVLDLVTFWPPIADDIVVVVTTLMVVDDALLDRVSER